MPFSRDLTTPAWWAFCLYFYPHIVIYIVQHLCVPCHPVNTMCMVPGFATCWPYTLYLLWFSDKLARRIFHYFFRSLSFFALALLEVWHLKHLTGSPDSCGIITALSRAFWQWTFFFFFFFQNSKLEFLQSLNLASFHLNTRVCVCVGLLYSVQRKARGVPYLLQGFHI